MEMSYHPSESISEKEAITRAMSIFPRADKVVTEPLHQWCKDSETYVPVWAIRVTLSGDSAPYTFGWREFRKMESIV